jgi:predicted oxidoreductase
MDADAIVVGAGLVGLAATAELARAAAPHKILDPKAGPLIAVRLNILTRKDAGRPADRPVRAGARPGHAAETGARPVRGG